MLAMEKEDNGSMLFIDIDIVHHSDWQLTSSWCSISTDTGLIMNYLALTRNKSKSSVVSGFIFGIHGTCCSRQYFHDSINKAKQILVQDQYPPSFYNPIIDKTLNMIIEERRCNRIIIRQLQKIKFTKILS